MASGAYSEALRRLYSANLFLRVKQGLRNTHWLMHELGSPHLAVPVIHVAGTNGKGSVCWKLAAACEAAGLRTGLFSSPHVSSFRERVRINGEVMSESDVVEGLGAVDRAAEATGAPATFFERTTAMAMRHFDAADVDVAVLETGLGGRLDSTNVVPEPLAAVLTTIGMDHTSVLGDTVEQVAWEKAGIAKRGRPLVAGPCTPQALVGTWCRIRGAPFLPVPHGWWPQRPGEDERFQGHDGRTEDRGGSGGGGGVEAIADRSGWLPRALPTELLRAHGVPVAALPVPPELHGWEYDDDNSLVALWALRAVAAAPLPSGRPPVSAPRSPGTAADDAARRLLARARRTRDALAGCGLPARPAGCSAGPLAVAFASRPPCRMDAVAIAPAAWASACAPHGPAPAPPLPPLPASLASLVEESATQSAPLPAEAPAGVVVFDAAHNPEAMLAFAATLGRRLGGAAGAAPTARALVLACSEDRDPSVMAAAALPLVGRAGLVFVAEADASKAMDPAALGAAVVRAAHPAWAAARSRDRGGGAGEDDDETLLAEAAAAGLEVPSVFRRRRHDGEEAAEDARRGRAAAAAASRAAAGVAPGARLSLDAERDEAWKRGEVDAASGVGLRYGARERHASAVGQAVREAMLDAARRAGGVDGGGTPLVIVCGSVYAMREARQAAGIREPVDDVVK